MADAKSARTEQQIPDARAQIDEGVSSRVLMFYSDRVSVLQQDVELLEKEKDGLQAEKDKLVAEVEQAQKDAIAKKKAIEDDVNSQAEMLEEKRKKITKAKKELEEVAIEQRSRQTSADKTVAEGAKLIAEGDKKLALAKGKEEQVKKEKAELRLTAEVVKAGDDARVKRDAILTKIEKELNSRENALAEKVISYEKSVEVLKKLEKNVKEERKGAEQARNETAQEASKAQAAGDETRKSTGEFKKFCSLASELKRFIIEHSDNQGKIKEQIDKRFPIMAEKKKEEPKPAPKEEAKEE